jgi:GDP/UDP-N,N'-diacetylbacillosamine 2-epimerase (hydrolysing)
MITKRKILAVTGARSEYDILFPVLDILRLDEDFDLEILVTGAHLSERYGYTANFIEADGFKIADRVYNLINSDKKIGRAISLGQQIAGIAQTFDRVQPDIILVVGDREEAITVALTGAYMDIPVAHLAGGDIAKDGNIDNSVRYATSKLAHVHFTILDEHRNTLLKLGEDDWRIHSVGNPALDRFLSIPQMSRGELSECLNFSVEDDYLVLIQHPIITDYQHEAANIRQTLEAIVETGLKCLINYPNSDAGNHAIIEAYHEYASRYNQLFLFQNLNRNVYVNLLRYASCLLGNSSSGIIEAPSLGLPVINIGARQRGRIHASNVKFVGNFQLEITEALNEVLTSDFKDSLKGMKNPYGDGTSARRIVEVLRLLKIDSDLLHKNITYSLD